MRNKKKRISILFYVAAALMYIVCIRNSMAGNTGLGATYMCLASANLCNGSLWLNKCKRDEEENDGENV